jgi:protein-S-isoprenylcysteine O-methyltransferase Ste14
VGIVYVILLIAIPYGLEQIAYWQFTVKGQGEKSQEKEVKTITGYGWAYLWDIAHFVLLVYAIYRLIWQTSQLTFLDWSGIVVFILGILLRITALRELGEFYGANLSIQRDHQVITSGPYAYLRHPLHLGTDLQIIGLAGLSPFWLGIPAVLAVLVLTIHRNHFEDVTLMQHLGDAYRHYYQQTWDPVDILYAKEKVLQVTDDGTGSE